ncbi:hypothetical protein [Gemmiger formicilis]|uniref:hypothetical protein n=1 Tax=Gemmiger formicilis TaxID=745368 RepID=UPI003CCA6F22
MPGVTEQEIAQAKQMNLYQYMQLCERTTSNLRTRTVPPQRAQLVDLRRGWFVDVLQKTKATGRTALNYLIAVEGVSFVEAVREINRIQGGVRPSSNL